MYDKPKCVNCDRCEKASLEMVEMGLLDRSRYLRLLELGFVNVRAVTEVMALLAAERPVREEGNMSCEIDVSWLLSRYSSVKDVRCEKAAGSMC